MSSKDKEQVFKNIDEYRAYYRNDPKTSKTKGNKYYRIGSDIAKLACEKATNNTPRNHNS